MDQRARSHLIKGARLLDVASHTAPYHDILIIDGAIADIGEAGKLTSDAAPSVFDARDLIVIPGLVNSHSHSHGALAKGLGDRWALEHLLNASRWLNSGLLLEDKYLAGLLNAAELVTKGCTAVYDLYGEFPLPSVDGLEAVARAYSDVGMRAVIAPMVADYNLFQSIPGLLQAIPDDRRDGLLPVQASAGQAIIKACQSIFETWRFDRDWIRPALAPTIPLHCSTDFIRSCQRLAEDFDLGMQMHLGESRVQAIAGIERYGVTLTAYLDQIEFLGPHLMAAHCVWLDDDDLQRLADNGCSVAHNPGSNMRLGSGIASVRTMVDLGISVGLGTDGSSCSDHQNMFEAMRLASFVSRIHGSSTDRWFRTDEVAHMGMAGGARAMRLKHGSRLTVGEPADIVFLDLRSLNFVPFNDPTNQLVHSEDGSAVDSVMIGGKWVLKHREFQTIDIANLRSRVAASVERLRSQSIETRKLAEGIETYISSFCAGALKRPYHISRLCGCDAGENTAEFRAEQV